MGNVAQKRTIRPLYANTQATPWGGYLDPAWDRSVDIYPGMVLAKGPTPGETFTLATNMTQRALGLSALFVAPVLGIDEVKSSGANNLTCWVGGPDAFFEILAPAFDPTANWTLPTDGTRKLLTFTVTGHPKGAGLVTVLGTANASTSVVADLVNVVGTSKIIIRLNVVA